MCMEEIEERLEKGKGVSIGTRVRYCRVKVSPD